MDTMTVTLATANDLPMLLALRLEMLRIVNRLPENHVFSPDFVQATIDCFSDSRHVSVLACVDGKAVGCATLCALTMLPTFDHPTGHRGHLMNVYTQIAYRRRGVGHAMVAVLVEEARRRGMTEISLDATAEGRKLYQALGFQNNTEGMVLSLR